METSLLYATLSIVLLVTLVFKLTKSPKRRFKLPPSPPGIPVIGHLHLLKQPLHRSLYELSQKHGPIFSLRMGSRLAVVVSSQSLAEECFTKNDVILANRPKFLYGKFLGYNFTNVFASPYGDHWRNLRRIMEQELLSNTRLNTFTSVRKDQISLLLADLCKNYYSFGEFAC